MIFKIERLLLLQSSSFLVYTYIIVQEKRPVSFNQRKQYQVNISAHFSIKNVWIILFCLFLENRFINKMFS